MVVKTVCLLALATALVGCQSRQATAAPAEFNLNEVFALGGGQQASIRGENLGLRFTDVLEDSRCPTAVDCVWIGQAASPFSWRARTRRRQWNSTPTPPLARTGRPPPRARTSFGFSRLIRIHRHPNSIALEDYLVTLSVQKISS